MKALFLTLVACLTFVSFSFAQNYPPYRYIVRQPDNTGVAEAEIFVRQQAESTYSIGPLNSAPTAGGTPTLATPASGGISTGSSPHPATFQGSAPPGPEATNAAPNGSGSTGLAATGTARIDTAPPTQFACPPYAAGPRVVSAATPAPAIVYRPVVPVFRMPRSYVVGRGILGQPKVYVPGQPVRNTFRWLTP